jgi:hypothetical protein
VGRRRRIHPPAVRPGRWPPRGGDQYRIGRPAVLRRRRGRSLRLPDARRRPLRVAGDRRHQRARALPDRDAALFLAARADPDLRLPGDRGRRRQDRTVQRELQSRIRLHPVGRRPRSRRPRRRSPAAASRSATATTAGRRACSRSRGRCRASVTGAVVCRLPRPDARPVPPAPPGRTSQGCTSARPDTSLRRAVDRP